MKTHVQSRRDMSNPSIARDSLVAGKTPQLPRSRRYFCNSARDECEDNDERHEIRSSV
jgi:hypothetical protein